MRRKGKDILVLFRLHVNETDEKMSFYIGMYFAVSLCRTVSMLHA